MDNKEWLSKSILAILNSGKSAPEKHMVIMQLIETYEAMRKI